MALPNLSSPFPSYYPTLSQLNETETTTEATFSTTEVDEDDDKIEGSTTTAATTSSSITDDLWSNLNDTSSVVIDLGGSTSEGLNDINDSTVLSSPYRTCLDPLNELVVHNFQPPSTNSNVELMSGEIYISLLQDSTPIEFDSIQEMEEYTLSYLADNIGGDDFEAVCVHVNDYSYAKAKTLGGNEEDDVESNTLLLLVTYTQKTGSLNRRLDTFHQVHDRLLQSRCTPIDRAKCCTQSAINNNLAGQYCTSIGCNQRCGTGRQPKREIEDLIGQEAASVVPPFVTKDVDYCCEDNYSLAQRTVFDPQMTLAELDVKDIDDVAACSANRYSVLTVRLFMYMCPFHPFHSTLSNPLYLLFYS